MCGDIIEKKAYVEQTEKILMTELFQYSCEVIYSGKSLGLSNWKQKIFQAKVNCILF